VDNPPRYRSQAASIDNSPSRQVETLVGVRTWRASSAIRLLAEPARPASQLLPDAAARNRSLFYRGGAPRSVGELLRSLS